MSFNHGLLYIILIGRFWYIYQIHCIAYLCKMEEEMWITVKKWELRTDPIFRNTFITGANLVKIQLFYRFLYTIKLYSFSISWMSDKKCQNIVFRAPLLVNYFRQNVFGDSKCLFAVCCNVLKRKIHNTIQVHLVIYYQDGLKWNDAEQLKSSCHYRYFQLPYVGLKDNAKVAITLVGSRTSPTIPILAIYTRLDTTKNCLGRVMITKVRYLP